MIPENDLHKIIRYASKAPSGHNTQPWKFKINENSITIHPDFSRALPFADSDNHELYISIGCALENLNISAHVLGYQTHIQLQPSEKGMAVQVQLHKDIPLPADQLFSYLEIRQVRRNHYLPEKIPQYILDELTMASSGEGIHVKTFTSAEDAEALAPFILDAAEQQFRNQGFISELVTWIRFSEKEAMRKGDGISTAAMGIPGPGRTLGGFMFRNMITPGSERKRLQKIISNSAAFVLLGTEKNDTENWIELGRAFQRFGLTAAKNGISHSHMNMPCEVPGIRKKLMAHFGITEMTPLLLLRIGYSRPMPYSFRRHLNELIIKNHS